MTLFPPAGELALEVLRPEAFAPFGRVIDTAGVKPIEINDGSALRYDRLAEATVLAPARCAGLSVFVANRRELPMPVELLERHPLGAQAFVPLHADPYVVVVADDVDGRPARPRAFMAEPGQGVSFGPGVWHHPLIALRDASRFLVVDAITDEENCDIAAPAGGPYRLPRPNRY
jgi:ureidoglycolate lyase